MIMAFSYAIPSVIADNWQHCLDARQTHRYVSKFTGQRNNTQLMPKRTKRLNSPRQQALSWTVKISALPPDKQARYQLKGMVDGPQVRSEHVGEKQNILHLLRIETQSFSPSSVTILTDLVNVCFGVTNKFKLSEVLPISGPYLGNFYNRIAIEKSAIIKRWHNRVVKATSQNCEKRVLGSSCLSIRLSVRMEQLGSHWTEFHKVWYLSNFRKSVEKIHVSLTL